MLRFLLFGALACLGRSLSVEMVVDVGARRCVYEELAEGTTATFDVFVGEGGKLDILLRIAGPMDVGAAGLPKLRSDADVIVDRVITQKDLKSRGDAKAVLDDAYSTTVEGKGGAYQICVENVGTSRAPKRVQVDVHVGEEAEDDSNYQKRGSLDLDEGIFRPSEGLRMVMKDMELMVADLIRKQQRERHRLAVHNSMNEESHSRMVTSSILETLVYVFFTVFQVIFIRNWFANRNPRGGRGKYGA